MTGTSTNHRGAVVPYDRLSPEALQRLIEEYVSRDGTDTGFTKSGLQERVEQVMGQIRLGTLVIVFDERSQTVNIVSAQELKRSLPGFDGSASSRT